MTQGRDTLCDARHGAMASRRRSLVVACALTVSALFAGAATFASIDPRSAPGKAPHLADVRPHAALVAIRPHAGLLDPSPAAGPGLSGFGQGRILSAALEAPPVREATFAVASLPPVTAALVLPDADAAPDVEATPDPEPESAPDLAAPLPPQRPTAPAASPLLGAPMPVPRPAEAPGGRRLARAGEPAATPAPGTDGRSFFQRLFGQPRQPAGPELAYAPANRPVTDATGPSLGERLRLTFRGPVPRPPAGTAIYDISARTVYLPNGEQLRAHSGLGDKMDNPRYAHVRMEGPTPPHTYDLVEREAPFHGVRAIRLNPVGGAEAIHGRTGLLAHHFLMGPRGDSNGCLSIEHYDRFLQAYLRGEIRRLVVVARSS